MAAALTAAGVNTATDPRSFHPPAVLLVCDEATPRTSCNVRLRITLTAAAPGIGHGDGMRWLDGIVPRIWDALGYRLPGELVGYESPATGDTLLAWQMTRITEITTDGVTK